MNEKLNANPTSRIFVNNVFGKNIGAYLGPIFDSNKRAIFAQARPGGQFYKVGVIDINSQILDNSYGDDNYRDAQKVIGAL